MYSQMSLKALFLSFVFGLITTWTPQGSATEINQPASRVGIAARYPEEAARVHVIQTVCSHDKNGPACQKDIEAFWKILNEGFGDKRDRLVRHDLTGLHPTTNSFWTPRQMLQYMRNMEVGENDVVIVFHSGHGSISDFRDAEGYQNWQVDGGLIRRGAILNIFRAKSIRALISLSDCCSNYDPRPAAECGPGHEAALNVETVRHLFLRVRGEVSLTAAENGRSAIAAYSGPNPGDAGSAFTVALLGVMYHEQTYAHWAPFFEAVREATRVAARGAHLPHAFRLPSVN